MPALKQSLPQLPILERSFLSQSHSSSSSNRTPPTGRSLCRAQRSTARQRPRRMRISTHRRSIYPCRMGPTRRLKRLPSWTSSRPSTTGARRRRCWWTTPTWRATQQTLTHPRLTQQRAPLKALRLWSTPYSTAVANLWARAWEDGCKGEAYFSERMHALRSKGAFRVSSEDPTA